MRDRSEFPEEQPGAARTAGPRRLSRLTWRATQLSAVTAVGLATLFARAAPAHTAASDTTASAAKTSPPAPAPASSSPGKAHPKRARATVSARAQAAAPAPQAGRPGHGQGQPEGRPSSVQVGQADSAEHSSGASPVDKLRPRPDADGLQHIARGRLMPPATTTIAGRTVPALGTFATVLVADPDVLAPAHDLLAAELDAVDAACSRFRADSELSRVNHARGRPVPVSPLFTEALAVALDAAELTDGDVVPGSRLAAWRRRPALHHRPVHRAAWPCWPPPPGGWSARHGSGRSASGGGSVTLGLGSPAGPPEEARRHRRPRLRLRVLPHVGQMVSAAAMARQYTTTRPRGTVLSSDGRISSPT